MEVCQYAEVMEISASDEQWLLNAGQEEAANQSVDGIALVMQVIINRMKSECYPDTAKGVVTQEGQFESYAKSAYINTVPTEKCYLALEEVKAGMFMNHPIIAFEVTGARTLDRYYSYAFTAGDHDFYTEKIQ